MRVNPSVFVRPLVLLSVFLLVPAAPPVLAQGAPTANYQEHIHLTGFLMDNDLPGDIYDMHTCGNFLYAATYGSFSVIDVTNRHQPQLLGSVALPTRARELAMSRDENQVVVVGDGGLSIIDVSDPAVPRVVGAYEYEYSYIHLAVVGHLAVAAKLHGGAQLLDISSPDDIRYLGSVDTPYIRGMAGRGDYAYICEDGLTVVDLSDPANPSVAGTVGQGNTYMGLAIQGDLAYVTGVISSVGLHVYDLSDPVSPVLIGVRDEGFSGHNVAVVGDRAYVAGDGFAIYDVSDPTLPTLQASVGDEYSLSVACTECYVFVGGFAGLRIYNAVGTTVAGPFDAPVFEGPYSDVGYLEAMCVDGDRTYIYTGTYLCVYNWGKGQNPQYLGRVHVGDDIRGMAATGDIVLLCDIFSGVMIVDISDLENPRVCSHVVTPGQPRDIFLFGTVALVVDSYTLQILDFADPYQATLVGELDTPGTSRGAALAGDTIFLAADSAGLQVIDVADPLAPVLIGSAEAEGAGRLDWDGDLLAVALTESFRPAIRFCDVTNPADPQFLGATSLPRAGDVALHDGFAYVASGDDGVIVLDARDPVSPYPMGTIFDYSPSALYRLDDYILCGKYLGMVPFQQAGVSGLGETPRPAISGALLRAYPNPFNPKTTVSFSVGQAGPATLKIYDLAGRKVATLADRIFAAGEHEVHWYGQDDRGRAVPSGVYCVEVTSLDGRSLSKISLVR